MCAERHHLSSYSRWRTSQSHRGWRCHHPIAIMKLIGRKRLHSIHACSKLSGFWGRLVWEMSHTVRRFYDPRNSVSSICYFLFFGTRWSTVRVLWSIASSLAVRFKKQDTTSTTNCMGLGVSFGHQNGKTESREIRDSNSQGTLIVFNPAYA